MRPTVSVCIPTHNAAKYLAQAVESVLAQDFDDFELVICDDASTDGTEELCARYADHRVRYLRFAERAGQAGNFNRCLSVANGELITLLHADDYELPGFLKDRVSRLRHRPDAGFAFGAVEVVDASGHVVSVSRAFPLDRVLERGDLLNALLHACLVSPPSLMVRKTCADAAGQFRMDLTWGHDWEWTLRLAEQAAALYVAEPLAAYRVHDESGTAELLQNARNAEQERQILDETLARLSRQDTRFATMGQSALRALSRRQMYFAELSLLNGWRAAARYNLRYAARADASVLWRPTFWALLAGTVSPLPVYSVYRWLRHPGGDAPLN